MKRIILTESQYKRLVRQPLNEQKNEGEIIYLNRYSEDDIYSDNVIKFLNSLKKGLWDKFNKNLFIKKIDDYQGSGFTFLKVYIDIDKYSNNEKKYIKRFIKKGEVLYGEFVRYGKRNDAIYFDVSKSVEVVTNKPKDDDVIDTQATTDDSKEEKVSITFDPLIREPEGGEEVDDFKPVELSEVPDDTFSSNIPKKLYDVMYLVSGGESKHNYNIQGGERSPSVTLTDKTIKQVSKGGDYGTNAKGRWQLMPEFMEERASAVGLKDTDKFSKINQDKMAMYLIKGWENWDCKKLGDKLAKIWAPVPVLYDQQGSVQKVKRGESFYKGVSTNKARIGVEEFETAIRKTGCVDIEDVPEIPFRNKTEGDTFRQWVNNVDKEYAEEIDLSETGDWKKGQKNFKGFMLKAWIKYGKKYMDSGEYKELEEVEDSNSDCKLSKCQFRTKKGCKTFDELTPDSNINTTGYGPNFHEIPDGKTNFRSAALSAEQMLYALETYDIKNIISFDDGDDGLEMKNDEEKKFIECYNKSNGTNIKWTKINGQNNFKTGKGYVGTLDEVLPLSDNTLIHCTHGADRTGYVVAKHLKDLGKIGTNEELWDYTVKYNSWGGKNGYICKGENKGYIKYLEGFYPHEEWCGVGNRMEDCPSCKKFKDKK